MKHRKRKIFAAIVSVILSVTLLFGSTVSVSALELVDIFAGMLGSNSGSDIGSVNISQVFSDWLGEMIAEEEDSPIDEFVNNIKNQWNGATDEVEDDDTAADTEEVIVIDKAEADIIAELFNLSVNEIKKSKPSFVKIQEATMDETIAQSLQGGLGVVTGLVESLIGTKDLFAGIISGAASETTVTTEYPFGNDVVNNVPISGKDYVACLTGDDVKDYTITIYKSGAYTMHIDLPDVEGSAADSALAHVFDVTDKAYATIQLGTYSLNINVLLKYVDNYVECRVDRDGNILSYTMGMGITFLFQQEDGTYGPEMPYLGVNFEEEGIIYKVTTEYSSINFALRDIGDADDNGKVNSSDARTVLRVASQLEEMDEVDAQYCDINGDGKITSSDAREILRASAELTTLPTTEALLGYSKYVKDESVQNHTDDLLAILMAYQAADDAEKEQELKDYYDSLLNGGGEDTKTEETTTGTLNDTGEKIDQVIGGIGDIISGDSPFNDLINGDTSGLGNLIGDLFGTVG